ncbi:MULTISPECIES: hypothetical protein [Microbispora]|uniref:Uncharacterized protein n=1 Tax=Microbispora siamensis TaxID=564413 RepID=A0ABQ4GF63_9ACTN|nr:MULTISPECIES: hypothetical protein [Microbispora]GIH60072.1 hypothetical protein Msi02_08890 [Microbispora siamensis]
MSVGKPEKSAGRSGSVGGITWDEAAESPVAAEAAEAPDGREG